MAEYLSSSKLHIPGRGHIYIADIDTEMFDLDGFKFNDDTTHTDWMWLGDAAADSPLEISSEAGEQEVLRTWDRPNARTNDQPGVTTGTITLAGIKKEALMKAFPGAEYDADSKSYEINTGEAFESQLLVVTEDGKDVAALRFARVSVKASLPAYAVDSFQTWQLSFTMLRPEKGGAEVQWFEPRAMTSTAAPGA